MTITIARPIRRVAAVVAISAIAIGGSAGAAPATTATTTTTYPGTVNTAGGPLTVRSGWHVTDGKVGEAADGSHVEVSCQINGSRVTGTYGTTTLWDKIGTGRFVSDAYVYTGHDGQIAPTCQDGQPPGGQLIDDYPYKGQGTGVDPWNFYKGQCTSFVAWRLNDRRHIAFTNWYKGHHFGNANTWDEAARAAGIPVNHTPSVGAVAQWNSGNYGHVAWVTRVNAGGTVTIEEYNHAAPDRYSYRTLTVGSVENYIHF